MNIKHRPQENTCFDIVLGVSSWIIGFFEGVIVGIISICGKKNNDNDDLLHELEIFTYEMESGYSTGKKDAKIIRKIV
jgi:hypothetical protein